MNEITAPILATYEVESFEFAVIEFSTDMFLTNPHGSWYDHYINTTWYRIGDMVLQNPFMRIDPQ